MRRTLRWIVIFIPDEILKNSKEEIEEEERKKESFWLSSLVKFYDTTSSSRGYRDKGVYNPLYASSLRNIMYASRLYRARKKILKMLVSILKNKERERERERKREREYLGAQHKRPKD